MAIQEIIMHFSQMHQMAKALENILTINCLEFRSFTIQLKNQIKKNT
jgi:hypothetical protein